jgi:uncharacterized membrane protein YdfJ with MMPL/SSD domain
VFVDDMAFVCLFLVPDPDFKVTVVATAGAVAVAIIMIRIINNRRISGGL